MSSKEDKKAEKLRLTAEKKAAKEAEKAIKKAEKEKIAADKKAAKEAKKSGKTGGPPSPEPTESEVTESVVSEAPSLADASESGDGADAAEAEAAPPAPGEPTKQSNPIADDGVGLLSKAWASATAINIDPNDPPSTHLSPGDFDAEHHVHIGEGAFGMIYEGQIARSGVFLDRDGGDSEQLRVVVKKLAKNAAAEKKTAFLAEAAIMEGIDHDCVLRCLGSVTQSEPMMIVYENHGHGDLKSYLGNSRNAGLDNHAMVKFTLSIAQGLAFLHGKSVVHKDLATRNCLVTHEESPKCRIGDYGLGRIKFPNDYQALPDLCDGTLPVRWMAPESLGALDFSTASDVWSFGVTIWEIMTHGNMPYSTLSTSEVPTHVTEGNKLNIKGDWPAALTTVFGEVMQFQQADRAAIGKVVESLTALEGELRATTEPAAAAEVSDEVQVFDESKFSKLKTARKSYRSLGTFKHAENPAAEFEAAGMTESKCKELDRSKLIVEGELGQGAFGVVVKGKLTLEDGSVVPCACKTLKDATNADSMDALLAEAELVAGFEHPNVVACYGQLTVGDPAMIVFEFMSNGSLYGYLEDAPELPRLQRLMKMAIDTSKGMAHLEEKNFIHRDLATRNVLVAEDLSCKISDFGLSRDLDDDTYYESEGGMVPIRWTPPEAYKYKKYSTASDVWSYGITLYEIWTKGSIPYGKKWTNMNVMLNVEKGFRLPPPAGCPKAVYQLMVQTWNPRRKMRPTFASIKDRLEMAYDMMFPDEDDQEGTVTIDEEDYGELEEVYLGVEVPTEENLDEVENMYLMSPTPVAKADLAAAALAAELEAAKNPTPKVYVGRDVGQKPDRFSTFGVMSSSPKAAQKFGGGTPPTASPLASSYSQPVDAVNPAAAAAAAVLTPGSPKPDRFAKFGQVQENKYVASPGSPQMAYKNANRGSLRKQKVGSEETDKAVEYTSSAKVAEVLALSRQKETQSAVENHGVQKVAKLGADVKNSEYVENVGRAVEAAPMSEGLAGGRKRCVCRRFKCVCGFK